MRKVNARHFFGNWELARQRTWESGHKSPGKLLIALPSNATWHGSLLDPYHPNEIEGRKVLVPEPPEIVEGEPEYEVNEVLDSKILGRKVWYHVDCVGYSPEERTWEPAENLAHSEKLVTAYQRHPNRPSPTGIPTRTQSRRSSVVTRGVLSRTPRDTAEGDRKGVVDRLVGTSGRPAPGIFSLFFSRVFLS
jgi:Chromo (CHRromatin Organisation MOdifier) domain